MQRKKEVISKTLRGLAESYTIASCDEERLNTDIEALRFIFGAIKDENNRHTYKLVYEEMKSVG